jgi:hypothetical protein
VHVDIDDLSNPEPQPVIVVRRAIPPIEKPIWVACIFNHSITGSWQTKGEAERYAELVLKPRLTAYAADLRSKLAEATNRHDYYPDYQEAVAKLAEVESREAALRASIKEAQSLLADMHSDPPLNSGARWRGECPEGCQACAVLRVLSGDSTSVSTQERK